MIQLVYSLIKTHRSTTTMESLVPLIELYKLHERYKGIIIITNNETHRILKLVSHFQWENDEENEPMNRIVYKHKSNRSA